MLLNTWLQILAKKKCLFVKLKKKMNDQNSKLLIWQIVVKVFDFLIKKLFKKT